MRQLPNMHTASPPGTVSAYRMPAWRPATRPSAFGALAAFAVPAWGWLLVIGWLLYGLFEPLLSPEALALTLHALALQTALVVALLIALCRRMHAAQAQRRPYSHALLVLASLLLTAGLISMLKGERPALERRAALALARADYEHARALSASPAAKGDARFQFLLYRVYAESPTMHDPRQALMWLERAAASGHPRALDTLRAPPGS